MPWYEAFGLGIVGNLIPVPFLLLFFDGVSRLVQKVPVPGKRFIEWLLKRTARHSGSIQKYKFAGLADFVAIPLPLTGAWTASLVAVCTGLEVLAVLPCNRIGCHRSGIDSDDSHLAGVVRCRHCHCSPDHPCCCRRLEICSCWRFSMSRLWVIFPLFPVFQPFFLWHYQLAH